jgi:Zn-finger nucleic acid-binding protein
MPSYRDAQPPGFEITRDLRTWETTNKCPRCQMDLYAGEKDGVLVEACGRCGGIWFADEQAKRALALGSRAAEELARKVEAVTRPRPKIESARLACPECQMKMTRTTVGGQLAGAPTVDRCDQHGTWFDREELGAAMRVMRGESPEGPRGVEARYLESLRSPFSGEIDEIKRTLGTVLQALLQK